MKNELCVTREEKEFYIENCPITINKNSFKKGYLNIMAKEKGSGRNILFHTCNKIFMDTEEIGKVLILASAYKVDVLVIFTYKRSMALNQVFKWLEAASKKEASFILIDMSDKN